MSAFRTDEAAAVAAPSPSSAQSKAAGPSLEANFRKRFASPSQDFVLEVDFHAAPGFTILFGPSGAGKTTVLDCVAGLAKPDSGRIAIGDRILFDAAQHINLAVEKRHVGYVFQSLALFPHLTVEKNVQYGLCASAAVRASGANVGDSSSIPHRASRAPLPARNFWRRKPARRLGPHSSHRSCRAASG